MAPAAEMVHAGSWYGQVAWPHDGNPYESSNFVVFSDSASVEARQEAAEVAERLWAELVTELDISPEMLRFPPGQDKIDMFAYQDHYPQDWGGRSYYGGLLIWSADHTERPTDVDDYAPVIKHELVHVIEYGILGHDYTPQDGIDVWFSEGLAEAMVGGTSGGAITDLDRLDDLTSEYGAISPVSIKRYPQITGLDGYYFHYPMFQLAVEYLIDEESGRSPRDAIQVLIDVAGGVPFETAFEDRMGIRLDDFENEFFNRMSAYLPQ
ncbi:MAG: hypothetical protein OEV40_20925 [Acidimicrobiia bacterium]|nr:hypothetical protein [Acidimicrobiia bacterium]